MCACAELGDRACSSFRSAFCADRVHLLLLRCALRKPALPSPNLLGAALRGECVWHRTWVRLSARPRCGVGRHPLPRPAPPSLPLSLPPDAARRCPPSKAGGKLDTASAGRLPFLSLHTPGRRPRALLLSFGTEHVQVFEKVGGGEPGEEPAGSGHE